jgi:hypothetical protein
MKRLRQLKVHLFPPITQPMALTIAQQTLAQPLASAPLICHGSKPDNCSIYCEISEPCWYIYAPWNDEKDGNALRSSRVIVIGRETGMILYDGSASDEG